MLFRRVLQTVWDWRAAGNFMFGGTGAGLLPLVALTSFPNPPPWPISILALAFIAVGLGLVWLEIGRKWRFVNVLFHPHTSWMSREAFVALLMFGLALAGVLMESSILIGLGGVSALGFLYCQARILKASKGIPAWREPAIVPLIMTTGLTEGTGVLIIAGALIGETILALHYLLVLLVICRVFAWLNYRNRLKKSSAPADCIAALDQTNPLLLSIGSVLPAAMILGAGALPTIAFPLVVTAGFCATASGWLIKFVIVTRAAQYQGYELKIRRSVATQS